MTEQKKWLAIAVLVIWLLLVLFFMILARNLSLEIFFVPWQIVILVLACAAGLAIFLANMARYRIGRRYGGAA